tara:strand:+ start:6919 stop:7194 length:276 start_codon:yes stop_codon:yes gene_type:complete
MCLSYNRKNSMSASFVTDSSTKEGELYIDNIEHSISDLEFLKEDLDQLSDNFTPTLEAKEKTDKILYHIKAALNLSKSQLSDDGLRQGKED